MSATGTQGIGHDPPGLGIVKQMKIDLMAYEGNVDPETIMNNPDDFCGATIFSIQDQRLIAGIPNNSTIAI